MNTTFEQRIDKFREKLFSSDFQKNTLDKSRNRLI